VAIDTAGNVYIAEVNNHRVRKVNPAGTISTFAGNGLSGFGGDGGPATAASMSATGVAVDTAGNVYIADQSNNRIRKVNPSGIITTFAGTGVRGSSGDGGPATSRHAIDSAECVGGCRGQRLYF
jgi:sugar lactone lactonase YvrE